MKNTEALNEEISKYLFKIQENTNNGRRKESKKKQKPNKQVKEINKTVQDQKMEIEEIKKTK